MSTNMSSYDFFQKEYPDEVKLLLQGANLEGILQEVPSIVEDLFGYFLEVTEEDTTEERRCIGTTFGMTNTVEHTGSGEYSSSESSTYGGIYNEEKELVMEFNYSIGQAHCSEDCLLSFECYYDEDYENKILNKEIDNEIKESIMANLSTRTTPKDNPLLSSNTIVKQNLNTTGDNSMTTRNIRTVNLTLNDNDTNLDLKNTLVFQATLVRTEHSDDKTIQNLLMSGKVQTALEKHNEGRASTVDKSILKATGAKVFLDPVAIWDLEWKVVCVA